MPRVIPAEFYESDQEILIVMNAPVGQQPVAFVSKPQQNAEQIASIELCSTIAMLFL